MVEGESYELCVLKVSLVTMVLLVSFSYVSCSNLMELMLFLCCYMTSFNCGGKKIRDVGLTYRCQLSNIMIVSSMITWDGGKLSF